MGFPPVEDKDSPRGQACISAAVLRWCPAMGGAICLPRCFEVLPGYGWSNLSPMLFWGGARLWLEQFVSLAVLRCCPAIG